MANFCMSYRFLMINTQRTPYKLLSTYTPLLASSNGLVLGVYSDDCTEELILTPAAKRYNERIANCQLVSSLKCIDKECIKEGKSYIFYGLDSYYQTVAVVGLGKSCKKYDSLEILDKSKESIRVAAAAGCRSLQNVGIENIFVEDFGDAEAVGEGSTLGIWKYQGCKTKQQCTATVNLYSASDNNCTKLYRAGVIKANAQNLARRLTDMPSNLMTPTIFIQQVEEVFAGLDVQIEVYDEKWARKKSMGAFLAVAQGSREHAKFLELTYKRGNPCDGPYILVGKGITFDSGGVSLKRRRADTMRGDMSGGAVSVAALHALVCLNTQANVKVLIPLAENMLSGKAIKPGYVVKAMNGRTIAVNDTDAEGRLILADAITYSTCFKPAWVMDVATLTGAMVTTLGSSASGVFTNSDRLYKCLEKAGSITGDRVWRMPLWDRYGEEIRQHSGYDFSNIGGRSDSCTAAAFLREFMPPQVEWLHVDIAGVFHAQDSRIPYLTNGMTGRPTRTIIEFIMK